MIYGTVVKLEQLGRDELAVQMLTLEFCDLVIVFLQGPRRARLHRQFQKNQLGFSFSRSALTSHFLPSLLLSPFSRSNLSLIHPHHTISKRTRRKLKVNMNYSPPFPPLQSAAPLLPDPCDLSHWSTDQQDGRGGGGIAAAGGSGDDGEDGDDHRHRGFGGHGSQPENKHGSFMIEGAGYAACFFGACPVDTSANPTWAR